MKSPGSVESFVKSGDGRTKLFSGDSGQQARKADVDPLRRDVVSVRLQKWRQRLHVKREHLGTRIAEHSTEHIREFLHFWRTAAPRTAAQHITIHDRVQ